MTDAQSTAKNVSLRPLSTVAMLVLAITIAGCPYESPVPMGNQQLPTDDVLLGAWIPTQVDQADVPDSVGLIYVDISKTSDVDLQFEYQASEGDIRSVEKAKDIDLSQEAFITDLNGVPILNVREGDKFKFYRFAVDEPFLKLWSIEERHFKDSEDELVTFKDADCLLDYAAARMERDGFFNEAFEIYVRKSPSVSVDVVFDAGREAYEAKHYEEALLWLEAASNLEIVPALTFLGYMYEKGMGTKADTSKAIKFYERAARQGDTNALAHLGALVYEGQIPAHEGSGLEHQGGQEALEWWMQAVGQNDPIVFYNLGIAYAEGKRVKQDVAQARSYFKRADSLGYEPARDMKTMVSTSQFLSEEMMLFHYKPALQMASAVCNGSGADSRARREAVEKLEHVGLDVLAARFKAGRVEGCTTFAKLEDLRPPLEGLQLSAGSKVDLDYLAHLEEQVAIRRELLPGDGIGLFLQELALSHQYLSAGDTSAAGQAFDQIIALSERVDYSAMSPESALGVFVLRLAWEVLEMVEPKVAMQYAALLWQTGDPRAAETALSAVERLKTTQQLMAGMVRGHPLLSQLSSLEFTMPDVAATLLPAIVREESASEEVYEQLAAWKGEALKGLRVQSIVMRQAKEHDLDSVTTQIRSVQQRIKAAYFHQASASVAEWKHLIAKQDSLYDSLIEGVFFGGDPVEALLDTMGVELEELSGVVGELNAQVEAGALSREEALAEMSILFGAFQNFLDVFSFETLIPEVRAEADPWEEGGLEGLKAGLDSGAVFIDVYQHHTPSDLLQPLFAAQGQEQLTQASRDSARYAAVIVTRSRSPVRVDLGLSSTIDRALTEWRTALATRDGLREANAVADLMDELWAPIVDVLPGGTQRLWVSPDGRLAQLPWNWLTDQHPETWDLEVAHIPSARALLRLLTTEPNSTSSDVLLVGDVDFGEKRSFTYLPSLPATEGEVRKASMLAEAANLRPVLLAGSEATTDAVVKALPTVRYAHLATHGFFAGDRSVPAGNVRSALLEDASPDAAAMRRELAKKVPLVESGLALAGANESPHGLLTAEELASLDLSGTQLVVLSACDTGRGTEITGQGVMGLRASLFAAGARSLLLSLWKVPDESTALLMEYFYRGLWEKDLPPAVALREAQAHVQAKYPGPIHWAAWVLDGEAWPLTP